MQADPPKDLVVSRVAGVESFDGDRLRDRALVGRKSRRWDTVFRELVPCPVFHDDPWNCFIVFTLRLFLR